MKKDKIGKTMSETLSKIDSVLVSLDGYPEIEDALLEKANGLTEKYLGKMFPTQLDFSLDILEHLVGRDVLIDIISGFITTALPGLEIALKAALLANMKNIATSCTIDPFIYERAIKEGVVFDLKQIDLYDKLKVSPLDKKIGQYYYFGIEDCNTSYDILQSAIEPNNQSNTRKKRIAKKNGNISQETSYMNRAFSDSVGHYFGGRKRDFDCLLWYMKNKGVTRQVWGKRTDASEDVFNGSDSPQAWVDTYGDDNTTYYEFKDKNVTFYTKHGTETKSGNAQIITKDDEDKEYVVTIGGVDKPKSDFYTYRCQYDNIKKVSRNTPYYIKYIIEGQTGKEENYEVYCYRQQKWDCLDNQDYFGKKYNSIEEAVKKCDDDELDAGDFIIVDNNLLLINEIEFEPIVTELKAKKIHTTKCVDVTKDVSDNRYVFVDYDEKVDGDKTKKDQIDNGQTPETTFGLWLSNTNLSHYSPKTWKQYQRKCPTVTDAKIIYTEANTVYYIEDEFNKETKVIIPPYDQFGFYVNVNTLGLKDKYTKDFGILTLEYNQRTGNILQSDGNPMHQQTPYDNSLHVFFGNVKELPTTERNTVEKDLSDCSEGIKIYNTVCDKITKIHKKHNKLWKKKQKELKKNDYEGNIVPIGQFYTTWQGAYNYGHMFYDAFINGGNRVNREQMYKEQESDHYESTLDSKYIGYDDINFLITKLTNINEIVDRCSKIVYTGSNDNEEFNLGEFVKFEEEIKQEIQIEEKDGVGGSKRIDREYCSLIGILKRIGELYGNAEDSSYYIKSSGSKYPDAKKNYYLYRTLFEFNNDYINSIQLFDPKVVAAQLISSLFGGITMNLAFGASVSWKTELIRDTIKDMVEKTIASEDFSVSDCFFTFTNDAYNGMLRAADLRQAGLYSAHGEENGNRKVDPIKLLEGLNDIDSSTDKIEQTTVIKGAIMNATAELSRDEFKKVNDNEINFYKDYSISSSFLEKMMTELCTQLVMALLSPKVYLLILINLELFGLSTNFDIKAFIERFFDLLRNLVKSIVDYFMQYLKDFMMVILFGGEFQGKHYKGIIPELTIKIGLEQVEMYARLLKQILLHLRMFSKCGKTEGWMQDFVDNADISETLTTQEPIDEC